MAEANKIDAEKIDFNKLFDQFWYVIPEYQRSYVWDVDSVNDLLDDLHFAFLNKPDSEYFLGSLVLRRTNQDAYEEYEVLDGQQRLTTLLLLLAVIRDITHDEELQKVSQERIYQRASRFRGIPERTRIVYRIRDAVESFMAEYVLAPGGTKHTERLKELASGRNISITNMVNAIRTMQEFFTDKDDLEEFSAFFPLKSIFIYVSTESREDAFRLFTILNNRGVPLTNADILKSMNVGEISDPQQEKYARLWEEIEKNFGDSFDRFLSFLRTILVKEKARVNLLEEFEENVYKKGKLTRGVATIDLMQKYSDIYDRLLRFEDGILDNDYKNLVTVMRIGLPSEDWIPPLMFFYHRFGQAHLFAFLKKLEFKFATDWIVQKTPTERIEAMNDILKAIEVADSATAVLSNTTLFAADVESLRVILSQAVYGRRFARYILLKYEYLKSDNTVHLSDYTTISAEHVLPQHPPESSQWLRDFTEDERLYWTHRLANLVLISKRKNSRLSNLDFADKKERYLYNRIDIFYGSKIFVEQNSRWTPVELQTRQEEMLDLLLDSY